MSPRIRFAPSSGHSRFLDDADRCDEAGTGEIPHRLSELVIASSDEKFMPLPRMQEHGADALAGLDAVTSKARVPTLNEVRSRVDRRIALAAGRADLAESGTGMRMLDLERTAIEEVAAEKLEEIRDRLGLPARMPSE